MTELRSRFVMTGGFRTHYTESGGDGPTLVALHGGGAGSSGRAGMAPLMRALDPSYRIIAPDSVGGFGLTDADAPAPYGLQSRVDHLEALADALSLDRFTLLGNSQGAWAAARYASLHPDRVERLIMIGSATLGHALGYPEEQTPAMSALLNFDGSREGMRKLLQGLVYNQALVTDELIDLRLASYSRPGAAEATKRAGRANRYLQTDPVLKLQFDMRHILPTLTQHIPTLVIWGENDNFAPVSLGRAIEPMLPAARFEYIAEAGHQVQNDQATAVASLVGGFMEQKAAAHAA